LYVAENGTLRKVDEKYVERFLLEKDGEDQLDRSCEKLSIIPSQIGEEYPTQSKKKEG
jgi:hypothetical protein